MAGKATSPFGRLPLNHVVDPPTLIKRFYQKNSKLLLGHDPSKSGSTLKAWMLTFRTFNMLGLPVKSQPRSLGQRPAPGRCTPRRAGWGPRAPSGRAERGPVSAHAGGPGAAALQGDRPGLLRLHLPRRGGAQAAQGLGGENGGEVGRGEVGRGGGRRRGGEKGGGQRREAGAWGGRARDTYLFLQQRKCMRRFPK